MYFTNSNSPFLREALFIKKNKQRWEKVQQQPALDADEMAANFTRLVDDLAYAKTFYPGSKVTRFLNSQAAKIYLGIYKNRKEESNRLAKFWKYDLPLTIRRHHTVLLFSFIVFTVFFAVGFFSAGHDETFVRDVLGDGYVNMTEKNIQEGHPFGVYNSGNSFWMWVGIMINNIIVSLMYFVKGLALGIFSVTAMIKEAMRLGAFEQFFFAHGFGLQSVLVISIHGILEISSIIISCAAGVVMGKSLLFPGTQTRLAAWKRGTKDGVKIVIGLVPVFAIAAFFEGFVTRHAAMPRWLSLLILLLSLSFVTGYFVLYPIILEKKRSSISSETTP